MVVVDGDGVLEQGIMKGKPFQMFEGGQKGNGSSWWNLAGAGKGLFIECRC